MMTVPTKDQWWLALWWVGHRRGLPVAERIDWLCVVWRPLPEGDWQLECRFREHVTTEVWDLQDEKTWFEKTLPAQMSASAVITDIRQMQRSIAAEIGGPMDILWLRCRGDRVGEIILTADKRWLHLAVGDKDDG